MERGAFEKDLRPLLRRSGAYAASFFREQSDAEDAVQQAALAAWKHRSRFHPGAAFKPWWFAILRNQCLDELRRRNRRRALDAADKGDTHSAADESAVDRLALTRALALLPTPQSDVLRLRYFAELSYEELARALEIPVGTVMSRLHLARKALATHMRSDEA